jgi:sigma-B regulation protein RsbU (phosphoserine phosphatase)
VDDKTLFRKIERNLRTIEPPSSENVTTLHEILRRLVDDFQDDLGLLGGRIYERRGPELRLRARVPRAAAPRVTSRSRRPTLRSASSRTRVLRRAPRRRRGGPRHRRPSRRDALRGDRDRRPRAQIVAFTLRDDADAARVGHTLNTIRHAINLKLQSERFADRFAEARAIQLSLLPRVAPSFADFDVHGSSIPAEDVGGDLYDFVRVSSRSLGIAVADASGHGLPAALQARDAIIGCAWASRRTSASPRRSRS